MATKQPLIYSSTGTTSQKATEIFNNDIHGKIIDEAFTGLEQLHSQEKLHHGSGLHYFSRIKFMI